jgi:hypothetical protein
MSAYGLVRGGIYPLADEHKDGCRGLFDDASFAVGDEVGQVGYVLACVARGDGFADGGEGVGDV